MKTETVKTVILTADEGMTLTNGESYCKKVYLAVGADQGNWREIPDSEAEALKAEKEAEINGEISE